MSQETASPDHFPKKSLLINGGVQGPLLEANWGDWLSVKVTNNLTHLLDGFSLHMHGLFQRDTPWFDGVPGVSQCPIAPGKSFTYQFRADQFGTSWYHSHYSSQYTDGALGPLVIYGPRQRGAYYDQDLGVFVFRDYYHGSYELYRDDSFKGPPPVFHDIDNNLLNGIGCDTSSNGACNWTSTSLARYRVSTGRSYRMRFVNTGAAGAQKIFVDNHKMTVISKDFVPVVPYTTDVITLGVGQRTDVILHANGAPRDAVYVRGQIDVPCTNGSAVNSEARAIIQYQAASPNAMPRSSPIPWKPNGCQDDPIDLSVPLWPQTPPSHPSTTQEISIDAVFNETGAYLFTINNSTFRANYNRPILKLAADGDASYRNVPEGNIYNFGSNETVRMIVYNHAPFVHPMHLHGHNYWTLAQGYGKWDGKVINPENPLRRDTVIMPPGAPDNPAYLVLQWTQDNPGIWPFHCHIALHSGHGLLLNVLERPEDIKEKHQLPGFIADTCEDWATWSSSHVVDETDSGI